MLATNVDISERLINGQLGHYMIFQQIQPL